MTHYQTLGVNPHADLSRIRRAFIANSRRNHPDLGSAAERETRTSQMRKINAAYRVLRDPNLRAAYDLSLTEASQSSSPRTDVADTPVHTAAADKPATHQTPVSTDDWIEIASGFAREAISTPIRRWVSLIALSLAAAIVGGVGLGISVAVIIAIGLAVVRAGEVTPAHNIGHAAHYVARRIRAGSEMGMLWLAVRNRSWPWLATLVVSLAVALLLHLVVARLLPGNGSQIAAIIGFSVSGLLLLTAANRAQRTLL